MRLALALVLAFAPQAAFADWMFCVAESARGGEAWVTRVFPAATDRRRLEREFERRLQAEGVADADAQCPAPLADKTDAVNAQFAAVEFHRKAGDRVRESLFPSKQRP